MQPVQSERPTWEIAAGELAKPVGVGRQPSGDPQGTLVICGTVANICVHYTGRQRRAALVRRRGAGRVITAEAIHFG